MKRCSACGREKPRSVFVGNGNYARRCAECAEPHPCMVCGTLCDNRRRTCGSDECLHEARARAGAAGIAVVNRKRRREQARCTTRRCPGCLRRFAKTPDNFYVAIRDKETGEIRKLSNYCKSCERANQRILYAANPERRAKVLAKASARRLEVRERREVDPDFDAYVRERGREYNHGLRRRVIADNTGPDHEHERGGVLDPQPFLDWFERTWRQYGTRDFFCEEIIGVTYRTISRLIDGETATVQLDTVDAALIREGGTLLQDLYPEVYEEVAA